MRTFAALCLLSLTSLVTLHGSDWVFTGVPPRHRGPVSAVVHRGNIVLSAGEDGFLEIWNPQNGAAADRFQVSPYSIIAMAGRPGRDEVCLVENDRLGLYRVSAWNYRERRNIFTLRLRDPISHINYSMGGNFIIAARTGRTGLVFIDAASGDVLQSPQSLTGTIALAVTGRSERNMVVYFSSGALSYWDLETGNQTNYFNAPANLLSPVLFSNSRYLAGVNNQGLAIVHAASGEILARDGSVPTGSLLCAVDDTLICLVQNNNTAAELRNYSVDSNGRLINNGRVYLSAAGVGSDSRFTAIDANGSAGAGGSAIALGTADGSMILAGIDGRPQLLSTSDQTQITDAAVSGGTIAFITANGAIGFIPLNYSQFPNGRSINVEKNNGGFNRVTAFVPERGSGGQFIFWHDQNSRILPVLRRYSDGSPAIELSDIAPRSPIQSVSSFGGKIQILDTMGNLSVVSPLDANRSRPFTFFSIGLMDAAFVDSDRLIIGRSAVSGNTPFMTINANTGETVSLSYPSQAGITVHRGASGRIYTAVISSQVNSSLPSANVADGIKTSILQLNLGNSANSTMLVDFQGEDTQFSLAETPGGIAATIGGESAAIYAGGSIQKLDRTNGLPLKLIDGGQFLVCLDGDGNIAWHDNRTGKLIAVFRLTSNRWTVQTGEGTVSGQWTASP